MYVTVEQVRERGSGITPSGAPPATDDILTDVIEQASRIFDLQCGVKPGYFEPALYPAWQSGHAYVVGDLITPTTRNLHVYRVTTAGTSGATEPTWTTGTGTTVTSGTGPTAVTFTEHGADVVASTRVFYGDGGTLLKLDPYVPGTLDETITVPTGYTAQTFIEGDGYLIRADSTGIPIRDTPRFYDGWAPYIPVTVTAVWGFESTPADVKQAVIELAINLWRETDPASLKLVNLEGGVLRESTPPRVKEIARRYRANQAVFV